MPPSDTEIIQGDRQTKIKRQGEQNIFFLELHQLIEVKSYRKSP